MRALRAVNAIIFNVIVATGTPGNMTFIGLPTEDAYGILISTATDAYGILISMLPTPGYTAFDVPHVR